MKGFTVALLDVLSAWVMFFLPSVKRMAMSIARFLLAYGEELACVTTLLLFLYGFLTRG